MEIHLIDGTFELFRHFFAVPPGTTSNGQEVGAVRGVVYSVLQLLERGATHIGVATDHVIESFRNDLYSGYKTGDGIPPLLWSQFPLLEEALTSMGVRVWAMVEFEADDALAAAAVKAAADERVSKVLICTPDKDLAQCVSGTRIVQWDRMRNIVRDEAGVAEKFGVPPASIADYLALVGDTADGFPGIAGWGAKSASTVLASFHHLENIPEDPEQWPASLRGRAKLASTLFSCFEDALLYRKLATLRLDVPVFDSIDELRWSGPLNSFEEMCKTLRAPEYPSRLQALLPV